MKAYVTYICLFILSFCISCKKMIDIDPPTGTITTSQVFETKADATAGLLGIYSHMSGGAGTSFNNPTLAGLTIFCGMSADELLPYSGDPRIANFYTNLLQANNTYVASSWIYFYQYQYQANAVLEGLQASKGISQEVKDEFSGEAKFLRAFINFYLVNLFGDVPLITTTDYQSNKRASRTPAAQVYQAILNDLKEAKNSLPADYSEGGGERIRANKWAAAALLARVYLFTGDFVNAEAEASAIIENSAGLYKLVDLDKVFLKNSTEAILQWQHASTSDKENYNATPEGYFLIPDSTLQTGHTEYTVNQPSYYLTEQLSHAFEPGDRRNSAWVKRYTYQGNGINYAYPYKYQVGPHSASPGGAVTEYYTVLRLGEQYLIRAEARAHRGNLTGAAADVNLIRGRAGLDALASLGQAQLLLEIAQEKRIELFAEMGHRWLDLKRTGKTGVTFSSIPYKIAYKPFQSLYPIPEMELSIAPNLSQNLGY